MASEDGYIVQASRDLRCQNKLKADAMAWFSFRRRAKLKCVQRFERADPMVVKVFADLQQARYLKCNQFPEISPRAAQQFEREAWGRLIDYLVKLPPLPTDD